MWAPQTDERPKRHCQDFVPVLYFLILSHQLTTCSPPPILYQQERQLFSIEAAPVHDDGNGGDHNDDDGKVTQNDRSAGREQRRLKS